MSTTESTLFVGGLSWDTNEQTLTSAFDQFGEVKDVKIILDRETGRSRGFGFVTFLDSEEAKSAIEQLDGRELDGRKISVNFAENRQRRSSSASFRRPAPRQPRW